MKELQLKTLVLLFIFNTTTIFSKDVNTHHPIDTTIFACEFEQELFINLQDSNNIDPLHLLLFPGHASDSSIIMSRINNYVQDFKRRGKNQLSTKKQLKLIYKTVHNDFLTKYNIKAKFGKIFMSGEYNCVSASALYALILDRLEIDYKIKETPTHVYLIADPQTTNFLIETTLPINGLVQFDNRFKKSYVDYLHENKLISNAEYSEQTIDYLFDKHYSTAETIDLLELAGIHYYNNGLLLLDEEKYSDALNSFEKAEMLYESNLLKYLLSTTISYVLNNESINKDYKGKLLAKYVNLNSTNPKIMENGKGYFNNVSNELTVNHPDIDRYIKYFKDFEVFINDSIDIDEYRQMYHSFVGFYHYNSHNIHAALNNLNKSLLLNQENINTRKAIAEISINHLVGINNYESAIDSIKLYTDKYPFIAKEKSLQRLKTYCYSYVVTRCFQNNNPQKGNIYFNSLENAMRNDPDFEIIEEYLIQVYIQKSSYFIRKRNYELARVTLEKGLVFMPDSEELSNRLQTVAEIKNEMQSHGYY